MSAQADALRCRAEPTESEGEKVAAQRLGTLLVPVPGLSGATYPAGTTVTVRGRGATVDAFVHGDWLPLSWWEFSDGLREDIADR
ncbi:hypothetical protein SCWH03_49710 [Streptomyces pacificus]|uniref:Uncharacterized protein n=1 Tax=Streptomyces pacificus TaxID=2705029 RepID=A0A6A0B1Y5_9ACTN|nr:hypothetical protein SCWH03_49710 [Streptomyces pacificus]